MSDNTIFDKRNNHKICQIEKKFGLRFLEYIPMQPSPNSLQLQQVIFASGEGVKDKSPTIQERPHTPDETLFKTPEPPKFGGGGVDGSKFPSSISQNIIGRKNKKKINDIGKKNIIHSANIDKSTMIKGKHARHFNSEYANTAWTDYTTNMREKELPISYSIDGLTKLLPPQKHGTTNKTARFGDPKEGD